MGIEEFYSLLGESAPLPVHWPVTIMPRSGRRGDARTRRRTVTETLIQQRGNKFRLIDRQKSNIYNVQKLRAKEHSNAG